MYNLINIVDKNGVPFVKSVKDLYISVGMNKGNWSTWYKRNVLGSIFFKENIDYERYSVIVESNETIDFACTLDMGKHLVIQMPTEKAHDYRNYLINYEKNQIKLPSNYKEALIELVKAEEEKERLQLIIIEQKTLVEFADKMLMSKDSVLVRVYAKILNDEGLNIGEKKLYSWFRENGYLNKTNEPYQHYMEYFELKPRTYDTPFGTKTTTTTYIKPKGQLYFFKKIKKYLGVKE